MSNSANISSQSASFPFCVCAEKKVSVHTQPWLCKWESNRVALSHQPVLIPRSSNTDALSQLLLMHRTTLMLRITPAALKECWICLAIDFKYQQAFSRIVDYTFKWGMIIAFINSFAAEIVRQFVIYLQLARLYLVICILRLYYYFFHKIRFNRG